MAGSTSRPGSEPWHAVAIVAGKDACDLARALRGKRYLSRTEAPALPLAACPGRDACHCTYRHYTDRRGGPRRHEERSGLKRQPPKTDSREKRGRRDPDYSDS
jgi:hypothetical protein